MTRIPVKTNWRSLLAILAATVLVSGMAPGMTAGPDGFEITWFSIDAGGGASSGGDVTLFGTIGEPDTGVASGGPWTVSGGFLPVGPAPCSGDVDGNGMVAFADLLAVLSSWGACEGCPADVDGDGVVAFADLLIVISAWGPCP